MLYLTLLAHLLGDYVFQPNCIARWKSRSLTGVLAHGAIVTLTTLACTALADSSWWPYALLIGIIHTGIDVIRARLLHPNGPVEELIWYLLDQLAHLSVIGLTVALSGASMTPTPSHSAKLPLEPRIVIYAIGYALLLNPAWVLLRFLVRGMWGANAAPHLGTGEKYGPMLERVLIASCVLTGHFHLAPLILLPRRISPLRAERSHAGVIVRLTGHWAETALSIALAIAVGTVLRMM